MSNKPKKENSLKLIPHDINPDKVGVTKVSVSYNQDCDSMDDTHDYQQLNLSTEDTGAGAYFVLETKRWAFDEIDDLIAILQDFKNRI